MDLDALRARRFDDVTAAYSDKDTMLYALSVGAGMDPGQEADLPLVYEKNLVALPTMSAVLAQPGFWVDDPELGIDWVRLLHGEQRVTLHRPLPVAGALRGEFRVSAVVDKGPERGSLLYFEKTLYEADDPDPLCRTTSTLVLRADGGQGGFGEPPDRLPSPPGRDPDREISLTIDPRAALIYRLNSDRNPIHLDPEIARKAGFEKPLLHGLCTYGICACAIVRSVLGYDPARVRSFGVRFSAPVFPGEPLIVRCWMTDGGIAFEALAAERDKRVITDGFAAIDS